MTTIKYHAAAPFLGIDAPRFEWECPECGRDCKRDLPFGKHPDNPACQKLEAGIKREPRCTICLYRAGEIEAHGTITENDDGTVTVERRNE